MRIIDLVKDIYVMGLHPLSDSLFVPSSAVSSSHNRISLSPYYGIQISCIVCEHSISDASLIGR